MRYFEILNEGVSNALLMRAKKALISDMYDSFGHGVFQRIQKELVDDSVTEEDMNKNNNKWKHAIQEWASSKINTIYYDHFVYMMEKNDGLLDIWREITLDDDKEPDAFTRHPGIYWSWDKNFAESYNGPMGNNKWIFHAKIPSSKLTLTDWQTDPELYKIMEMCPRGKILQEIFRLDHNENYSLKELYEKYPNAIINYYLEYDYEDTYSHVSINDELWESDEKYLHRLYQYKDWLKQQAENAKKIAERNAKKKKTELELYLSLKEKFEGTSNG